MRDFKNMTCAACDVVFDDDSDIVVCPVCGAPHHRSCWQESGHCACESSHSDEYSWQPNEKSMSGEKISGQKPDEDVEMMTCPLCNSQTPKSEEYCEKCGYSLAHSRDGAYGGYSEQKEPESFFEISDGEMIGGVPAGDLRKFLGNMWIYYLPRFSIMNKKIKRFTFNFTAAIAHGLWFISRKMYALGALLLTVMTGITVYQMYYLTVFNRMFGALVNDNAAYQTELMKHPIMVLGMLAYYATVFLQCGIMFSCGIFGNTVYMKHCAKRVKKINASATAQRSTPEQFNAELAEAGGVAWLPMLSVGACYLLILWLLNSGYLFK